MAEVIFWVGMNDDKDSDDQKNTSIKITKVCVSACRPFGVFFDAAMDAGCGPGGTALQLCDDFKLVEAYDYSQGFVDMMLTKKAEKVGLTRLNEYCWFLLCQAPHPGS